MNENNDFSLQPEYPTVEETSRKDPLKCNNLKKIEGIGLAQPDDLRSLESYQEFCDSFVSDHFMIFSSFPSSMLAAEEIAQKLSEKISEFQRLGVAPVIVIEPADKFKYVPLKQIADGEYQEEINSMFQKLLQSGINLEKDMIWIPYPEINTPTWNKQSFSAEDFPGMIEKFNLALRANLPKSRTAVLFNAKSYDENDKNWENGFYESFSPYLEGLGNDQVQIFVIQGFPWISSADQKVQVSLLDPSEFLQPKLAIEAARQLSVDEFWINTGTFRHIYTDSSRKKRGLEPDSRKEILDGIIRIASEIQADGFRARIHLFADDKSDTKEAVDWSYHWEDEEPERKILFNFISKVYDENLDFSIFDSGAIKQ